MSLPLYLHHMPKTHHAMKWFRLMSQWTPKDNPPLPTTETNLRSGPDAVFICNSYVWKDEHGRAIKYGSQANSATNLSCVFIGASSPPVACWCKQSSCCMFWTNQVCFRVRQNSFVHISVLSFWTAVLQYRCTGWCGSYVFINSWRRCIIFIRQWHGHFIGASSAVLLFAQHKKQYSYSIVFRLRPGPYYQVLAKYMYMGGQLAHMPLTSRRLWSLRCLISWCMDYHTCLIDIVL